MHKYNNKKKKLQKQIFFLLTLEKLSTKAAFLTGVYGK